MVGPLKIYPNGSIYNNEYTWNKEYSLLFIDQPVGTGLSFASSNDRIPKN